MRSTPSRISPATYPIAATATAPAYDFEPAVARAEPAFAPSQPPTGQQGLFSVPVNEPRVIPFDSLTSPAERDAIRLRVSETARPLRARRPRIRRQETEEQGELELQETVESLRQPQSHVTCDAPVATGGARVQAALFDAVLIACGLGIVLALFFFAGGQLIFEKRLLPFLAASVLTVPLFYKLLWAFANRDTPGTRMMGLELIDFDGRRPGRERRFARLFGSVLSLLAAGIGMAWALVDEDRLTWHDHISGTFPTFSEK